MKLKPDAKIIHVNNWEEFRKLAFDLRPNSVSYTIQRALLSKPPVGLRIVFVAGAAQYVFLDFARGEKLERTRIAVCRNERGRLIEAGKKLKIYPCSTR